MDMMTETTLREVWQWLTTDALMKLKLVERYPLDVPLSYWVHVMAAGMIWATAAAIAFYQAYVAWDEGREEREKLKAKLKGLVFRGFGWRKKR